MITTKDGTCSIGGVPVEELAALVGTPVYVYDSAIMARQVARLRSAFDRVPVRLMYACKALTNVSVLRWMRALGCGLDAVSIQEVELGLRAGFAPENILFTPNMAGYAEYARAVALGVRINVDSLGVLEHFGHDHGGRVPVCVRFNPHIMAGGNERISTGHVDSKFGISIHQIRHVQRVIATNGMRITGLHMHTGSDILDAGVFLQGAEILLELAGQFPDLEFIDMGSGFKVPYKPDDIETDVEELGDRLAERMERFNSEREKPVELWFEPGKFLVSEAGALLARVEQVKHTTATVFAGLDTGLNHLIRPMLYGSYHRIMNVTRPSGKPRIYTVVGNICETDTFAVDRKIPELQEGDLVALLNAGAYGWSMSSNYNSRLRPPEVLVHKGRAHVIRERETMEDLLRHQPGFDPA
ncbi:MAG: diaminopimelate decarboxylase [Flavobacteriales bacterium]|nr:diaminopimelate decarboxylase [Flavobacteriales bacterium]